MVFGMAFTMNAQTATPEVKKTQVKQQKRIVQGVKSGELTKREAVKLEKQQKNIQRTKQRAKADGVVTKRERAVIKTKQVNASRNIAKQKNDRQSRNR